MSAWEGEEKMDELADDRTLSVSPCSEASREDAAGRRVKEPAAPPLLSVGAAEVRGNAPSKLLRPLVGDDEGTPII